MAFDRQPATRQPAAFLWLYAIAWAGGAVAYVPFLTILLPARVEVMTGDPVRWLAYMTFFGAIAASVGGILFGWLSDRTRTRRPWIAMGLIGTIILLHLVPLATRPLPLLLLIIVWQLALNMMLAPLAAWAADHVPSSQLGTLGGLLAFSPALGSSAGALVTIRGLASADGRLTLVAILVASCVLPALLSGQPASTDQRPGTAGSKEVHGEPPSRSVAVAMWSARFLVQISEAALFAYLYYYFRALDPSRDAASIARLFGLVIGTSVPAALIIGRWSDRHRRPIAPLVVAATLGGGALMVMASARNPAEATAGYVLFGLATTVFLSLHSAQTFRVLRRSSRRGRDLGIFNLTNTAPSLIMPWLTVSIVPSFGFQGLFALLSAFSLTAAAILIVVTRKIRSA
ncbi:MAG: MFS transporter [Pseudomonadota bacterium]